MFTKSYTYFTAILLSVAIFILAGCSGSGTSAANGQGAITAKLVWGGSNKATSKSVVRAPVGVATVRLAISGPTMTTIQQDFPAANGSGTLNGVPAGSGLTLTAFGLDASGTITYQGSASNVAVQTEQTTNVGTITLLPVTSNSLIGTWVSSTSSPSSGYEVVSFLDSSNYFQITTKTASAGSPPGLEKGTYTFDAATGSLSATTNFDTNGNISGLNGGSTGAGGVTLSGNTLTFTDSDGTYTFNRLMPSSTNPIVGAWGGSFTDIATGKLGGVLMVFLDDTNCLLAQAGHPTGDPTGQSGVEQATYTWNRSTGLLTATVGLVDTNGEWGFASPAAPTHSYTVSITGTTLNMTDPTDPTGGTGHFLLVSNTTPTVAGVWRATNGAGFNYLALYEDNTFLYAENDLTAPAGDNGVEVGTYTYDGTNITFNITYDRNGPGQNSGIGEIGTPKVLDSTLTNNGNTLTVAGGQLVLNRAAFNPSSVVGAWRSVNGAGFSYLILFNDNTFLYAENDLTAQTAAENGLEVGTYTFDGTNITFNIVYDDNAPGQNSGVGDIGTPKVSAATLSNNGNTLTVFGGQAVLIRAY
jgi:heat shock protein HslJ